MAMLLRVGRQSKVKAKLCCGTVALGSFGQNRRVHGKVHRYSVDMLCDGLEAVEHDPGIPLLFACQAMGEAVLELVVSKGGRAGRGRTDGK